MSMWWWPWSRKALKCVVNFKYVGSPAGVNSTRALKAMCMPSHFAGSGSLYNFYCLWKHLQMTSTSTEDEKGSWWTDRGWKKKLGRTLKAQKRLSGGKSLGIGGEESSWWQQKIADHWAAGRTAAARLLSSCCCVFGLSSSGCWDGIYLETFVMCTASGSSSLHKWKQLLMKKWLMKEDDRFLSSTSPLSVLIMTAQEYIPTDLLHTGTGCCQSWFLREHYEE